MGKYCSLFYAGWFPCQVSWQSHPEAVGLMVSE